MTSDTTVDSAEIARISGSQTPAAPTLANEVRIHVDAQGDIQVDVLSAITDVGDALESVGLDFLAITMYGWDSVAPAWSVVEVNAAGEIYVQITDGVNEAQLSALGAVIALGKQTLETISHFYAYNVTVGAFTSGRLFTAISDASPNMDGQYGFFTHSLLSARSNVNTTIGLTTTDGTYNPLHVRLSDGTNFAPLDPIHDALATIEFEHYEVHQGHMFIFTDVRQVPAGNILAYHIRDVGGATSDEMHANISISCDALAEITIYENPTLSNNGTLLAAHNKNRDTGGAPGTTFYHTPAITVNGLEIYNSMIMSATSPPRAAGGKVKGTNEWVFDSGDAYLIVITRAVEDDWVAIEIEFYEE